MKKALAFVLSFILLIAFAGVSLAEFVTIDFSGYSLEELIQIKMDLMDEIAKRHLDHVTVSQTGCAGMCRLEPMVDVYVPGQEKVTYVKLTPEMVPRIVTEHIVNGRIVEEYTIGAAEANK